MITSISNSTKNNLIINSTKPNKDNPIYNKQLVDNFTKSKQSNQLSFKGNLAKVGKNILGDISSNFGGKARRFGEEAAEAARGLFRKLLKGKDELPLTEKPLIKPVKTKEEIAKEIAEYNRQHPSDVKVEGPKGDSPSDKGWAEHWKNEAEKKHSNNKKYYDDSDNSNDLNNHDKTAFKGKDDASNINNIEDADNEITNINDVNDVKSIDEIGEGIGGDIGGINGTEDFDFDPNFDIDIDLDIPDFDPTDLL